jgi:hypothetical protein
MALALPRFFATFGIGRSLTILKKFAAGAGLARGLLVYDFGVQLFRDEASMPIEDASVDWSEAVAPFVTVGRLTIPKQDVRSPRGQKLSDYVETLSFDPWHALVEHRPLGDMTGMLRGFEPGDSQHGKHAESSQQTTLGNRRSQRATSAGCGNRMERYPLDAAHC